MANKVGILVSVVDEATGKLRQIRATADDMPNSSGIKSGFGMGIGAGIAMQATQMVISAVTGMASSIVQGAMDEEAAMAKLGQAFTNAGSSLKGNQAAVDGVIASNIKLGFTDDETINSLALLVTATGSLSEAQRFQAAAMDLARIKGIDLGTATEAMTKVEAGQYRALKSLGIVLPAHATALEALTAVEKVAGGQAQAFADTTAGSMASLDASVKELEDSIGRALLPVIRGLSGVLSEVLPGIESFTSDAEHMKPIMEAAAVVVGVVMVTALKAMAAAAWGALGPVGLVIVAATTLSELTVGPSFADALKIIETQMLATAAGTAALKTAMMDPAWVSANKDLADTVYADSAALAQLGLTDAAGNIIDTMPDLAIAAQTALAVIPEAADDAGTQTVADIQKAMAQTATAIRQGRDAIVSAMTQTIKDGYDPLVLAAQTAADKQALAELQMSKQTEQHTYAEKVQLDLQILQAKQAYDIDIANQTQYGSDAQRIATLNGQLSSKALLDALQSRDPEMAADARSTYRLYSDEIAKLGGVIGPEGQTAATAYTTSMYAYLIGEGKKTIIGALRSLWATFGGGAPPSSGGLPKGWDAFASGTISAPGGMALVGENGPELVNLPRGSSVTSAADTASTLGGRGATVININIDRGAFIDGPSIDLLTRTIASRLRLAGIS
jgi:hypothetical protein